MAFFGARMKPLGLSNRALCGALIAVLCAPVSLRAQTTDQIRTYEQRIEEQQRALDELRRELDALRAGQSEEAAATDTAGDSPPAEASSAGEPAAARGLPGPFLFRASDQLTVRFSGRVHRMLMNVEDGSGRTNLFTDSDQGPTMLRFDVDGKPNDKLNLGATIEVGVRQNRPLLVSQDRTDAGTSVTVRIAELSVNATSFGKFSFGRGFSAAWLTPEIDLSGTQFASLLSVGMLAGGLKFVDASTGALTTTRVLDHFADLERLLLVDRVRFDSRSFGPGLQLSGSIAADSRWDAALRAKPVATERWTVVGGATFQKRPYMGFAQRTDAGVSVLHKATGLNVTAAVSREELNSGRDADGYTVKIGWLTDIFAIGQTAFSLDYHENRDLRLAGDRSKSQGLFVVQKWPAFGTDFYGGIRRYDVYRPDIDLESLNVFVLGAALRF